MASGIELYTKNIDGVWYGVACDNEKVFATSFGGEEKAVLRNLSSLSDDNEFQVSSAPSVLAEKAFSLIKSIYDGEGENENISLAVEQLSTFGRRVLEVTRLIPVGYVTSYGSISKIAGGSPRAVGGVMASNPFAPIVPCHRVVKSDLTLGGYSGGLSTKVAILAREKRNFIPKQIPFAGKSLQIFPVEQVLEKL